MWFAGWDGFSTSPIRYFRIGYATSVDGIEWEVQNNDTAVVDVGEPGDWDDHWVRYCSVLLHENRLKMWYDGRGDERMIGYALGDFITGIPEYHSDLKVLLFPNPCKDVAKIEFTLHASQFIFIELFLVNLIFTDMFRNTKIFIILTPSRTLN